MFFNIPASPSRIFYTFAALNPYQMSTPKASSKSSKTFSSSGVGDNRQQEIGFPPLSRRHFGVINTFVKKKSAAQWWIFP